MAKLVNIKFLKPHPAYAYFTGDTGKINADKAAKLIKDGYIIIAPEKDDINNPLPEDLPARDILFENGFDTVEKVKQAGESILDISGIGKGTLKQLETYLGTNNE